MRKILSEIVILALIFTGCNFNIKEQTPGTKVLKGPYLGQKTPGIIPELFAPGIISTGMNERGVAITPDGKEIYYNIYLKGYNFISFVKEIDGRWTQPEIASFSGQYSDVEPFIHPDGSKLYFSSKRPIDKLNTSSKFFNIWVVERNGDEWTEPEPIGPPINGTRDVLFPSVTNTGTLYFSGRTDNGTEAVYRSKIDNGKYQEPKLLPLKVNTNGFWGNACISPDESYLIISISGRSDAVGSADYYVTFRDINDNWSKLINLGDNINTKNDEYNPSLSPDGRYFIFQSQKLSMIKNDKVYKYGELIQEFNSPENGNTDIYWISAEIIEKLKPFVNK